MKIDRVFVLLLVVMLPMTGCFDDAVGDADATDDTTDSETNTGTETSQSRTWYTSGGTYLTEWNVNNVTEYGYYCASWSSSQEYCNIVNHYTNSSEWNTTECTDAGGIVSETPVDGNNSYAPLCTRDFVTINTSAGEALLIYEWYNFYLESTCDGVMVGPLSPMLFNYDREYFIATGSAMDCTHRLFREITYNNPNQPYTSVGDDEISDIWSIVYAIQDVTVVS